MPIASLLAALFLVACSLPTLAFADEEPPSLTGIEVRDAHHATAVQLFLDGDAPRVKTYSVENPPRLLVELPGVVDATGGSTIRVKGLRVESVSVVQPSPRGIEIVIDATQIVDPFQGHQVATTDQGLLITVGTGEAVARAGAPPLNAPAGVVTAASMAAAVLPPVAVGPDDGGPQPTRADGLRFRVTEFEVAYAREHPDLPPTEELRQIEVELGVTSQGFVAPRDGYPSETVRIADIGTGPRQEFYGSAIRTINQEIVNDLNRRGLAGVLVLPADTDVDPRAGRDLRPADRTQLKLVVWVGRLLEARTFASGPRVHEDQRVDNPIHQRIKDRSPVQPGDLLKKRELDEYIARLNRHPGRNVDTALSAAEEPGGVYLDYLVAENRPFRAYFGASNTGQKTNTTWRQRFGVIHHQLTNRDDILRLDYITGNFDEVNAFFGSYESPIYWDRLRGNIRGAWAEYDSSTLGQTISTFTGTQWDVGGQAIFNVFQHEDFFADLIAGLRWMNVDVTSNPLPGLITKGESDFFLPEFGVRFEKVDRFATLRGSLSGEFNLSGPADTKRADLNALGRNFVFDKNFGVMRWDAFGAFFLEPLVNRAGYDDPSTPYTSTLAHEILLHTRGQYSFGNRLVPQFQGIAGGLRTVRGYNQSIVAGDNMALGRFEYRFHIARMLPVGGEPMAVPVLGDFRMQRDNVYGVPDWDLIFRFFTDVGRVWQEDSVPGEFDSTLVGMGPGIELRIKDNLVVSFDYGWVLNDVGPGGSLGSVGTSEPHFSATLIY